MRRQVPARLIAVAIAASSMMVLPFAGSAHAVAVPQCTKLVSPAPVAINKVLTSKSTVSQCTPLATTGGQGKSVTQIGITYKGKKGQTISTTTWAGGKGTTIQQLTYKAASGLGKCPKTSGSRVISSGKVIGGTNKLIKVGSLVSATVCVAKNSSATLEPGTAWKF
jgi:hypothetical protein